MSRPQTLLLPCRAGRDVLGRYACSAEAGTKLDDPAHAGVEDLVLSAHAPYSNPIGRLSIADENDSLRTESIEEIETYIAGARERFPNLEQINMHCSPKRWSSDTRPLRGDYDRLIDAIRRIGTFAERLSLRVVVENNRAYWEGVEDDTPAGQVDREAQNDYFGTAPEEWIGIGRDVDRANVTLCLDTSHACTYAQTVEDTTEREAIMHRYLEAGSLLTHFHWNGNDLVTSAGRQDKHFSLHEDTLPPNLHARICAWEGTHLLEHWYGEDALQQELAFIDRL